MSERASECVLCVCVCVRVNECVGVWACGPREFLNANLLVFTDASLDLSHSLGDVAGNCRNIDAHSSKWARHTVAAGTVRSHPRVAIPK